MVCCRIVRRGLRRAAVDANMDIIDGRDTERGDEEQLASRNTTVQRTSSALSSLMREETPPIQEKFSLYSAILTYYWQNHYITAELKVSLVTCATYLSAPLCAPTNLFLGMKAQTITSASALKEGQLR
ncbi:hypothetical protein EGR_10964 [Echinococcus granulosus]|uniref:Uncharacterized protein n=1 Tax=Echinococcus granulosus TaxID=6210 RepID=W6U732_ECHGR|nr:hypothetical protein EGR_10964 [Echinococcus granulosus]EUB54177.1 hypothetical protein EGR_10964 [Echinococcus granulosus]